MVAEARRCTTWASARRPDGRTTTSRRATACTWPIGNNVSYAAIAADTRRSAVGPSHQWPGAGDLGDPLLDQMLAGQNAAPQDNVFAHTLWASRGAELLD